MFADRRIRTSLIAIGADLFLTALKLGLALATGSAALLADAYHSGTDLVVSLVLLGSLVIRHRQERKADARGSERARKLECVLAILVALLILYVPIEILLEVRGREQSEIQHLWLGIGGVLVIIALVFFMARLKQRVGQDTDSPALEADGYHSQVDLFSSLAVLVSLMGTLVGLYLDEIVALIIALLIGVAGIELLISGLRGLHQKRELDPVSLLDPIGQWLASFPLGQKLSRLYQSTQPLLRRLRWLTPIGLILFWLSSSWVSVPFGYTGIQTRWGQAIQTNLEPGSHWIRPWPVDRVSLVRQGEIRSSLAGSRVHLLEDHNIGRLWREIKANRVHEDQALYLVTRDENLLDIQFELQYRLLDPASLSLRIADLETLVDRYTEAALWHQTARRSFDQVLNTSHQGFSQSIAQKVTADLSSLGVVIEVVDAQVQSLQPPALVVPVYRDLLNAEQEKRQQQNRAEAQQIHDLLLANAERVQERAQVDSDNRERALIAQGKAQRFKRIARVFDKEGEALRFEQRLQTLTKVLKDKPLWLTDPAFDAQDLRLWGPQGFLQEPSQRR